MPPQTTIFGRRHELNAIYALGGKLSSSGTPLGSLVGLTEQAAFALPLDWSEAVHSGLYGDHPLSVRGWMLPNAAEEDRGAFGRIITAFAGPGIGGITLGDIGLIRDWLEGARTSRIDNLREQLQPDWDFPSGDVDIPDDLPGLDEVKPPVGTADSGGTLPGGPVVVEQAGQKPTEQKPVTARAARRGRSTARPRSTTKGKRS